jgi:hypothetical protein
MDCIFLAKKNPAFGQNKVRANIFSGSLAVFRNGMSARRRRSIWRRLAREIFSRRQQIPFEFFRKHTAKWKMRRFAPKLAILFGLQIGIFYLCSAKQNAKSGIFQTLIQKP